MFEGFRQRRIELDELVIHARVGGAGPPLLLLHGYPQTHVMWHRVAPTLAREFTVVCPDLRGYGDSGIPDSDSFHTPYSKRAMANDQVDLMSRLGFERFAVAGHDRGGRVAHRLALDHPERVERFAVLDIVPTLEVFRSTDQRLATAYYHWFFLIQPDGLPETLIGAKPEYYLREKLRRWSGVVDAFDAAAVEEYVRCFSRPETIHATCEDYRAAASIDLEHDEADLYHRAHVPLLVLWGTRGLMHQLYDVPASWRARVERVKSIPVDCGHFLAEEAPEETLQALREFFVA
jgi:haloacetate dehalogenase